MSASSLRSRANTALALVLLASCGSTATPSAKTGNAWTDCYVSFSPSGNPRADVLRLGQACGSLGGMRALSPVTTATQAERDPADRYTFFVPRAQSCYRVFAAGDRQIRDLDLVLWAPNGSEVAGDVTHDAWPILPPTEPLCLEEPGSYVLAVSVLRGRGTYAVQVWGTDRQ